MATHWLSFTTSGMDLDLVEDWKDPDDNTQNLRIYNKALGHTVVPAEGGFGDPTEVRAEFTSKYYTVQGTLGIDAPGFTEDDVAEIADSIVTSYVTSGESPYPGISLEEQGGSYSGWYGAEGEVFDVNVSVAEADLET